jgi:hypothetical protein
MAALSGEPFSRHGDLYGGLAPQVGGGVESVNVIGIALRRAVLCAKRKPLVEFSGGLDSRHFVLKGISMSYRNRSLCAAVFAGLILSGCGDSGAQLKQAEEITKGIEDYLALIEISNQPVGMHHDKVTVTPATDGKSYQVAITGLRFGDEKMVLADLGEVDYRLTPQDADTYQVSDLKAPKSVTIKDDQGKPQATVNFETTAFTATWSKPLQNFLKLDWQTKDIGATVADRPEPVLHIDSASMTADGKEAGKGLLDQATKIVLNGLVATEATDGTTFKLDKLTGNINYGGFDFPAYRQMITKMNMLLPKFGAPTVEPADPAAKPAAVTDEDRKALADLVRSIPKMMAAYSYDFGAEGLTVTEAGNTVVAHLTSGGMAFGMKGINTDKAEADFSIKHDGLELKGAPAFDDPMAKAVLPKSGNLALVATDLPLPSLLESVAQAIPDLTSGDPQTAQGAQFMMMGAMMTALSKSTIKLRIDPSALETEKARLTADGELKLAMETPQKAVGVVNFALLGLDDLIALATQLSQTSPDAAQAMGMLQMLQTFAARETGGDGKPVDKFKLELTDTGATLINGKPLDGMMP